MDDAAKTCERYELKIFGTPYGDGGESLGVETTVEDVMAKASNHLQPGQHVRVYDADTGAEVNRIYPN
jgi:hypothetical protein